MTLPQFGLGADEFADVEGIDSVRTPLRPFGLVGVTTTGPVALFGWVDGWLGESHRARVNKTEIPIERSASFTDHAVKRPTRIVLDGWVSDVVPLAYWKYGDDAVTRAATPSPSRPTEAWRTIERVMAAFEPMRVFTHLGIYRDMLIVDAEAHVDKTTGLGVRCTITLEEVFTSVPLSGPTFVEPTVDPDAVSSVAIDRLGENRYGIIRESEYLPFTNDWQQSSRIFPSRGTFEYNNYANLKDVNGLSFYHKTDFFYPFYTYRAEEGRIVSVDAAEAGEAAGRFSAKFPWLNRFITALSLRDGRVVPPTITANIPVSQIQFKQVALTEAARHIMSIQLSRPRHASDPVPEASSPTSPQPIVSPYVYDPNPAPPRPAVLVNMVLYWNPSENRWFYSGHFIRPERREERFASDVVRFPIGDEGASRTVGGIGNANLRVVFGGPVTIGQKLLFSPDFDEDLVVVPVRRLPTPSSLVEEEEEVVYSSDRFIDGAFDRGAFMSGEYVLLVLNARQGRFWAWPPHNETLRQLAWRREDEVQRPLR